MATPLERWVEEQERLMEPKKVVWCDGSEDEARRLVRVGIEEERINGPVFSELNQTAWPHAYLHRSHPTDVARTEHLTYVCHPDKDTAGPNNNWMAPAEAKEKMAKLYVIPRGGYVSIPKYTEQGVDILSPGFTRDVFKQLAQQHSRKQVRVFINDHTALSSIGNAYADEILFDAQIHPKTFTRNLGDNDLDRLYSSILSVMAWGTREIEKAAQPIHVKVRDHMKVRNRRGEPCSRCGNTIRREGVHGHDVFFCPICQPASRKLFIDWTNSGLRKL
jgi:ribosomal protein S13